MTWLVTTLIGWGVPSKLAKPLLFIFAAALIVIALGVGKCAYDNKVIHNANLERENAQEKADRKADNAAAEQRRIDDARAVKEGQELKDVQVKYADPAERKRAYYRCIRLQQAARRDGIEPPACS